MPHLGRPYPYLPNFWAGEGWFWPYYLAWKYLITLRAAPTGPWSEIPEEITLVSDEGVCSSDCKTASWKIQWGAESPVFTFTMTASFHRDDVDHELHWDGLLQKDLVDFATCSTTIRFVIAVPVPDVWADATELPSGFPCWPPGGFVDVADYATGGTPFPHPTGGPPPS